MDWTLRTGLTPAFFIPGASRGNFPAYSDPWKNGVQKKYPDMKRLDFIGLRDRKNYNGLTYITKRQADGGKKSGGPPAHKRWPDLTEMHPMKRVSYNCGALSKEFLLSSGLARLKGTPVGLEYGSTSEDVLVQLLGARTIPQTQTIFSNVPANSLATLCLVKEDGSLNACLLYTSPSPRDRG